jgi:hypothetical protein
VFMLRWVHRGVIIFFLGFHVHFWVVLGFSCPFMGGFSAHGFSSMVFYFRLRN